MFVLCVTASCGTSRRVSEERTDRLSEVTRDSVVVRDSRMMVDEHDTLREVTMVTVQLNADGDTVRVDARTDRFAVRSRDNIATHRTATVVRVDTVFIERRDSVAVTEKGQRGKTTLHRTLTTLQGILKWVAVIVCLTIILVMVMKMKK